MILFTHNITFYFLTLIQYMLKSLQFNVFNPNLGSGPYLDPGPNFELISNLNIHLGNRNCFSLRRSPNLLVGSR